MDILFRDLRFSVRSLLKHKTLTIIAIVTLAIGIGSNSAIFSAVNALLIKPLPFNDIDRVVAIYESRTSRGFGRNEASMANFLDWRAQNQSFEQVALYRTWSTNITGDGLALGNFFMMPLIAFAGLALTLAAIGIFGVMSYVASQRSHEIGIRMAMEAGTKDVLKLIIGNGMLLVVIGVAIGLAGAFSLTRVMPGYFLG